jgi:hypothetical protein
MADLDCKIILPEVPLDVGRKFDLICGPAAATLKLDAKQFEGKNFNLPEKDKYVLKLLEAHSKDNEIRLTVTSYQTGKHQLNELQIENLKINPIEFEVKSLQDPKSPREKPFEFVGPISTQLPWYFWLSLILVLVVFLSAVLIWLRQKRKIKLYIAEANENIKIKPDKFIYQNIRQLLRQRSLSSSDLSRNKSDLFKLRSTYLLYLTAKFKIPFLYWHVGKALRNLRKSNLPDKLCQKTSKVVRELHVLVFEKNKKEYSMQDVEQMIQLVKKNVDEIETFGQAEHGL